MTTPHAPTSPRAPRDYSLDILRILATIAVITIHISSPVALHDTVIDSLGWWTGHAFDAAARWCVPVFIMISGALLLRPAPFKHPGSFYRRRLTRVLGALALWLPIYLVADYFVLGGHAPWEVWLDDFLHGNPTPGHLYFIFIIAGLYFATPFLRALLHELTSRQRLIFTLGVLTLSSAWGTLEFYFSGSKSVNIFSQWIPYVGYFLLGHVITAGEWYKRVRPRHLIIAAISCYVVMLAATRWLMAPHTGHLGHMGQLFYEYLNPVVTVLSLCVFLGVQQWWQWARTHTQLFQRAAVLRVITQLSALTFGVYLFHFLIILVITRAGKGLIAASPILGIITEILITTVISFGVTALGFQLLRLAKWGRAKLPRRALISWGLAPTKQSERELQP